MNATLAGPATSKDHSSPIPTEIDTRPRGKRPESLADSLDSSAISTPSIRGDHSHDTTAEIRKQELATKTIGYFLAKIALTLDDAIKTFHFADKRNWGPDEFEQLRALDKCLDEARKDFQELPLLLGNSHYYPNDRTRESLVELVRVYDSLEDHIEVFRMWTRDGGPINPMWVNETKQIQRDLHLAQCRAARRIFESRQESTSRCLGAFLVYRQQRSWTGKEDGNDPAYRRHCLNEIAACNTVGRFERFGDRDIAFICNFCDGYIVWEDIECMPSTRASSSSAPLRLPAELILPQHTRDDSSSSQASNAPLDPSNPEWQAMAHSVSEHEEKSIVFAPVAIASHVAPVGVEWQCRHVCRFCDEVFDSEQKIAQGEDDLEPYAPEMGNGFEDLKEFHDHLLWNHTPYGVEVPSVGLPVSTDSCTVM